jgi:hypothetical protein
MIRLLQGETDLPAAVEQTQVAGQLAEPGSGRLVVLSGQAVVGWLISGLCPGLLMAGDRCEQGTSSAILGTSGRELAGRCSSK